MTLYNYKDLKEMNPNSMTDIQVQCLLRDMEKVYGFLNDVYLDFKGYQLLNIVEQFTKAERYVFDLYTQGKVYKLL